MQYLCFVYLFMSMNYDSLTIAPRSVKRKGSVHGAGGRLSERLLKRLIEIEIETTSVEWWLKQESSSELRDKFREGWTFHSLVLLSNVSTSSACGF